MTDEIHQNFDCNVQQGESEGFDSCDQSSNLTQIGFKSSIGNSEKGVTDSQTDGQTDGWTDGQLNGLNN